MPAARVAAGLGSPSPRTCRRLQLVGCSPATMRAHKLLVDGGAADAATTPRFNNVDVWKTSQDHHHDLSVLPAAHCESVWSDTDLPPPPPPPPSSTLCRQRCSCAAGAAPPPPCMSTAAAGRVCRAAAPQQSSALATSPTSLTTFKPSPAAVDTCCRPVTLRRDDAVQPTSATRPPPQQQNCHAMSLHLHVKHAGAGVHCPPDNSDRSQQLPTT